MDTTDETVPGPLVKWEPNIITDPNWLKLEDFPETLYPPVHLDSVENSKEKWGDRLKGYPHIENMFLKATANYGASGNCYFNAIATLLYGSQQYWHTVKGHHLEYVDRVLRDHNHPRHTLYTKINSNLSKGSRDHGPGQNMWMRLCTPYAWQDGEILQVTADLYGAFIVQYTMGSTRNPKIEEVKIRGNYNSTHWMIRYVNGNHFQPLLPENVPLSEFSFPPITRENTKGKISIPRHVRRGATDLNHPWRSPMSGQDVAEKLLPGPIFREMNSLHFSLIAGFNAEDSNLSHDCLRLEYIRARSEPLQAQPLADGTETVRSKVIKQIEQRDDSDNESYLMPRSNHSIPPFTSPILKTNILQEEVAKVAMPSSNSPSNPIINHPGTPILQTTEALHAPSNSPVVEIRGAKKRLIRFITRAELERQRVVKQMTC